MEFTELYFRGKTAATSLAQGENVAVTDDGQIFSDSLTGTTAAYSPGGGKSVLDWCDGTNKTVFTPNEDGTWCELHGVGEETLADPEASAYQITALQAVGNKFYATGRHIINPAKVRLPSQLEGATYHLATVVLQKASDQGEMYDLHVWPDGSMITVGNDNTDGSYLPLIYTCAADADCYDAGNWEDVELDDWDVSWDNAADGRSVAANGDTVVVVGNQIPNAKGGFASLSTDGGKTFTDLNPALGALMENGKVPNLYNAHVFDNGDIFLSGDTSFWYIAE